MIRKLVMLAAVLALPGVASAQNPQVRSGFWFNGGIGLGSYGCEGCSGRESGGTLTLGLGGTLSQKVVIGGAMNIWAKEVNGVDVSVGTITAMIRFYPSATGGFYLTGGLGYGSVGISSGSYAITGTLSDAFDVVQINGTGSLAGTIGSGTNPAVNLTVTSASCPNRTAQFSGSYDSANRKITISGPAQFIGDNCQVVLQYPAVSVLSK